jgi:hypothetical protein
MPPNLRPLGIPPAGEWTYFAGRKFREVGRLRWEFQSSSNPGATYITDAEEGRCSCWPQTKTGGTCVHFLTIKEYVKRFAAAMNQIKSPNTQ